MITINPNIGYISSKFTVAGTGFSAASGTTVTFGNIANLTPIVGADCNYNHTVITTNTSGGFNCTFTVPISSKSTVGTHDIFAFENSTPFGAYVFQSLALVLIYDGILAQISVGTQIPSEISTVIDNGAYQVYVVNSSVNMSKCTNAHL